MTEDDPPLDSGPRPATRVWRAGLSLALLLAVAFAVVAPPERCPSVTAEELRRSAQAAVGWFVRNQETDGSWVYVYNADENSTPSEYNEVRHAGVTMGLYQAAASGLPGALRSADRGTEWALERLLRRDGWAALVGQDRVTTGATALLVAGLVSRREVTGNTRYDDELARLGRFLVAQTEPSGAVLASYDEARGSPVAGQYSKYYTGEAYWALARLHQAFPGEDWGEAANRIGAYLATSRDEVEDHWPPIPDHWAAYGMSETIEFPERGHPPLTDHEVHYARRQAELFGVQARWLSQRHGPWGGLVRGGYLARGGWYGVVGEALTGWWVTAQEEPRLADLRDAIAERATCVAGLAVGEQADADDAADAARPERVEGAWYRDGETRMDDQQHALAGLLRTIPIVEASAGSTSSDASQPGDDAPSGLLWAAALALALNPLRAAFGVPRAGRSPRTVVGLVAVGGTIGALAVCAAAAVGGPLLEALNVSEPSFRIAAGIVAGLAGAAELFRRPPSPEPALAGWRAALVPVAIPVVARPALLVMALGAGADRGVLLSAGAMVVGVSLLTGLTAGWPTEGPRGRALRWGGRLLAAALVACGVLLAVDGVLAV
jgi:small neutral amino acid transporter SnatA (MarC family)